MKIYENNKLQWLPHPKPPAEIRGVLTSASVTPVASATASTAPTLTNAFTATNATVTLRAKTPNIVMNVPVTRDTVETAGSATILMSVRLVLIPATSMRRVVIQSAVLTANVTQGTLEMAQYAKILTSALMKITKLATVMQTALILMAAMSALAKTAS